MYSEETLGATIRQFLRELFGSRLVERLELDLLNLRNDADQRIHEQSVVIATLREEKALLMSKIAMLEVVVMPRSSREGSEYIKAQKPVKPNFSFVDIPPTKSKWEVYQESYYKAEEAAEKEKAASAVSKE
jgi:hypothetical protein